MLRVRAFLALLLGGLLAARLTSVLGAALGVLVAVLIAGGLAVQSVSAVPVRRTSRGR